MCSVGCVLPCQQSQLSLNLLPPGFLSRSLNWGLHLKNRTRASFLHRKVQNANDPCFVVALVPQARLGGSLRTSSQLHKNANYKCTGWNKPHKGRLQTPDNCEVKTTLEVVTQTRLLNAQNSSQWESTKAAKKPWNGLNRPEFLSDNICYVGISSVTKKDQNGPGTSVISFIS